MCEVISRINFTMEGEEFNEIKQEIFYRLELYRLPHTDKNISDIFWEILREWEGFHNV